MQNNSISETKTKYYLFKEEDDVATYYDGYVFKPELKETEYYLYDTFEAAEHDRTTCHQTVGSKVGTLTVVSTYTKTSGPML